MFGLIGVGHCGKTEAIMRWFARERKSQDWLVIADDDTLLRCVCALCDM